MAKKERHADPATAGEEVRSRETSAAPPLREVVADALAWLDRRGSRQVRETVGPRYGIHTTQSFGVALATIHELAKALKKSEGSKGHNRRHELSLELWATQWYEARLLAAFIGDPAQVTVKQMDSWAKDFDNWAICDTACFHLFDKSKHARSRVVAWAKRPGEFVRRASFALLASVALHDEAAPDEMFLDALPLIEAASTDERNFVKKGVSWALRGIGKRNQALQSAACDVAERLAASNDQTARWIGKDALRDLRRSAGSKRSTQRVAPASTAATVAPARKTRKEASP